MRARVKYMGQFPQEARVRRWTCPRKKERQSWQTRALWSIEHRAAMGVGRGGGGRRLSDCSLTSQPALMPLPLQAAPVNPLGQARAQSEIRRLSPDGVRGRSPQRLYATTRTTATRKQGSGRARQMHMGIKD